MTTEQMSRHIDNAYVDSAFNFANHLIQFGGFDKTAVADLLADYYEEQCLRQLGSDPVR